MLFVVALIAPAARAIDAASWSGPATTVYLVSHGWHVGLVLPRDGVDAASWPEKDALGPFRYLEVGWGDGDYYPVRRGTIPLALRAAFRSRPSVLQVVGFDSDVTETFPRKMAALRAHASQTAHMDNLDGLLRGRLTAMAERAGLDAGRLAEAFTIIRTA